VEVTNTMGAAELVHRYRFATRAEAKIAIEAWIRRYNNVRLHSSIGYVPPIEWELRYRLTQQQAANGGNLTSSAITRRPPLPVPISQISEKTR
jgi:hypothetical protein